jgi:hypothetical protein
LIERSSAGFARRNTTAEGSLQGWAGKNNISCYSEYATAGKAEKFLTFENLTQARHSSTV